MSKSYPVLNKHGRRNSSKKLYILGGIVIIVGLSAYAYLSHSNKKNVISFSNGQTVSVSGPAQLPAAESGLLPWQLPSAVSRLAVFPGQSGNQLVLAGGLASDGSSSTSIDTLNTTNGALNNIGALNTPTHDAASAQIGSTYVIFGGGSSNSISQVEGFNISGSVISSSSLPNLRSDSTAVTLNQTTYIIGGYDGSAADATILSTTDGTHFSSAGQLSVPVRYAAAATMNGLIYIFGGEAVSGSNAGNPINTIQIYNPANKEVIIAPWKLPVPLEGATAFVINNEMFVAGGVSTVAENIPLGVGTTQVPGVSINSSSLTQDTIWAVNFNKQVLQTAGRLQVPVSNAGVAVLGSHAWIVGGEYGNQVLSTVQMVTPNSSFGYAGMTGVGSPYFGGKLMIADRGNNRLLVLDSSMNIIWTYPSASTSQEAAKGFYFPDDAFFTNHGTSIISNQEDNNTIIQLSYPSGKITWQFGHPRQAGSAYGYLQAPDDAYLLKNNDVVVADDQNCRVLFINPAGSVVGQIGKTGDCHHVPNVSIGSPNGDTPLYDGNILISEILGSYVSEYTPQGRMVWTTHLPISYPSDPQQIGASPTSNPDHYLIADYTDPGAFLEFTREGQILSKYQPTSGTGRLSYPSLVEMLPSGVYMANDDHRDRMIAVDPTTQALVWQYGVSDTPGTSKGMIQKPDGFDILMANGTTPTHGMTK